MLQVHRFRTEIIGIPNTKHQEVFDTFHVFEPATLVNEGVSMDMQQGTWVVLNTYVVVA